MAEPRVLVVLAPGAEEMEVAIVVDVLRRAKIGVVLAGLDGVEPVTCSRQLVIKPDAAFNQSAGPFDALVLPGGAPGAKRLAESAAVGQLLKDFEHSGRLVGALCAAPTALQAHGVFAGRRMTSYPSFHAQLAAHGAIEQQRVVQDGNLITSQGPGTAFEFALAIVAKLVGADRAAQIEGPLLL
ncbi:MAG TPA: DJ-1 family glyoxalase III [Polyangiaceae bacterium]|nr:DJ-1 family glyoxalase III [Polyangiaceae bacterium]